MNDYNFGNFLCMLREKNGMTQADVARKLGVTPAAVSKWENGSSKPRVEVLFELAQLLGVRTEELMCGHYIQEETLNPEAVKQINERYTYLMRVDSYNTAGVKWRRLLAWILDWNIIGLSVIFLISIVSALLYDALEAEAQGAALIMLFLILQYPICFVLRDLIFGGRSLGKRIMGLIVLDRQTGTQAKAGKCALRNLFLFALQIDVLFMLVSGTTLGDRAAHTVVVRKQCSDHNDSVYDVKKINTYSAPRNNSTKKTVFVVIIIAICAIALFVSIILIALSASRATEEFQIAYNYLTESQAFEKLGVDESKIWHNSYSRTIDTALDVDNITQTAEIGFTVKGKSFQVICHKQNDVWSVCDECTKFS